MKDTTKKIISIIGAFILTIFTWHNVNGNGNNVIWILIIPIFYIFINKSLYISNKRREVISLIIGSLFSIIEIVCLNINRDFVWSNIFNEWLMINFLGYTILIRSLVVYIYNFFTNNKIEEKKIIIGKKEFFSNNIESYILNFLLIFIAWIPYFLRYYPGLLTADSCSQVAQAIGRATLTNHHPIVHTGIIAIFVNIGINFFGNINKGVALYTIFQMFVMANAFALITTYISRKNTPLIIRILTLLYYMFYPINALFSITMWKDILFAGFIPLYAIITFEMLFNTESFFNSKKKIIIYIVFSILVMFLRNNGVYIVILTMPFVLYFMRKRWEKTIKIFTIILILFFIIKIAIFMIFDVKKGSVGEMLSVPLQQIVRVKKYHKEELDEEIQQRIDNFFKCKDIEEKYNPVLSDPVKAELNNEYFDSNKGEFVKLWLKLMKSYFIEYVESFISNSYGYYYPEAKHWVANRTMEKNDMGIEQHKLIEGKIVTQIDSLIEKREIPIVSMFFSIGMAFWIIVVLFGYKIEKKEYKNIAIYMIIFILWLTIIASPVFCEYRYAYPMFTIIPFYLSLNFKKEEKEYGKNSSTNTML